MSSYAQDRSNDPDYVHNNDDEDDRIGTLLWVAGLASIFTFLAVITVILTSRGGSLG